MDPRQQNGQESTRALLCLALLMVPLREQGWVFTLGVCSLFPLIAAEALSNCLLNDFMSIYMGCYFTNPLTTSNLAPGLNCNLLLSTYYVLA